MRDAYCVIGDPVDHSLSPAIYNELFRIYDMPNCIYTAVRVAPDGLKEFLGSLDEQEIRGFNVTMPLKTDMTAYLKYQDPGAVYGVNTVLNTQEGLKGYSTDAQGFREALRVHNMQYRNSRVTFLGCGGAGRTLIADCLRHHPAKVVLLNRTKDRCIPFQDAENVTIGSLSELARYAPETDLLVNTTPLGMHGVKAQFSSLDFLAQLPAGAFVADLIYAPAQTELLKEAERLGLGYMNGLWMLIWQAFYAFRLYTGIFPSINDFGKIYDRLTGI